MENDPTPSKIVTVRLPGRQIMEWRFLAEVVAKMWFSERGIQFEYDANGEFLPTPPYRYWRDDMTNELVIEQHQYDPPQ
jgi:hypothetical protein